MSEPAIFDLSGKVVLVTGGNTGIGFGFANGVARAGADVVVWGRRGGQNEDAVRKLGGHGVRAFAQQVDVADPDQVAAGMTAAVERMGRVDAVFANAGVQLFNGPLLDMPTETWREELAINQDGAMFTLREAARHMVERARADDPGGSLVACGSLAVVAGISGRPAYVTSKGGLASLTRALAAEFGHDGIRANMILPGPIATALAKGRPREQREARAAAVRERNPIPRMGDPADLEGIAVYLVSDASSYHTGDLMTIDGGLSITLP